MYEMYNDSYLMHHGVKGQKWGVRNWQYSDGSLTPAGRIHYGYGSKKSTSNQVNPVKRHVANALLSAYSKVKLADSAIGTGIGKKYVDTYLKMNTPLYRIQSSDTFENFAFYATYKEHDVDQYSGLFGNNLKKRANAIAKAAKKAGADNYEELRSAADNMKIYKLHIKAVKKLKIPSEDNAGNTVGKLLNDKEFRTDLKSSLSNAIKGMKRPSQQMLLKNAAELLSRDTKALTNGDKRLLYRALNLTLTNHSDAELRVQSKFYGALKKQGYSALLDINDKTYSSYHAKSPVIVFDTTKVKLQSVTNLSDDDVNRLYKKYNKERIRKDSVEQLVGNITKSGGIKVSKIADLANKSMMDYLMHSEDYLMHHGVKGQKWGVRRWQNKDGSLTTEGYIHYGYGRDPSGSDYRIKKGTSLQRITLERNEPITDIRKYVTYTKADNDKYSLVYPQILANSEYEKQMNSGTFGIEPPPRVFKTKLDTIKDLNVAGAKTYSDTFLEIYGDKKLRDLYGLKKKVFNNKSILESERNKFDLFLQRQNSAINQDFFNRLLNKGYDAVEDQYSRKVDKTDGPLIILKPSDSVMQTSVSEIIQDKSKFDLYSKEVSLKTGDKLYNKEKAKVAKTKQRIVSDANKLKKSGKDISSILGELSNKYYLDDDVIDEILRQENKVHNNSK